MLVIAVDGVAPGIGKSTLAAALAARLRESGLVVDRFREEDILTRPAYGTVARQFQETGRVEPVLLLSATERYLRDLRHDGVGVAVLDSLLPFVPSLLAWGHDLPTITAFVRDLTGILAQTRPLLVYLDGRSAPPWSGRSTARARHGCPGSSAATPGRRTRSRICPRCTRTSTAVGGSPCGCWPTAAGTCWSSPTPTVAAPRRLWPWCPRTRGSAAGRTGE